ncbi:MAG: AraC family transcriptional regulator [Gammaproteobacteria bacterium]
MDILSDLLNTFRIQSRIFHNGQYCGNWNIDTSGASKASFHIVTHGQCELLLNQGKRHEGLLEAGDLVLFPRDAEHQLTNDIHTTIALNSVPSRSFAEGLRSDGTGLVCGHLEFEHANNNVLFDLLPDYVVVNSRDKPWNEQLRPVLEVVIAESKSGLPGTEVTLNRLTEVIFMILIREYIDKGFSTSGLAAALQDQRISNVLQAIHSDAAKDWSVESLAEIAFMSRSAFAKKFKDLLDISPLGYVQRWRMHNAYRWLRDDKITVSEAAQRTGYSTEASFSKAFKREIGKSPSKVKN